MSDLYQVITPENVAIDYELAGVGSRFLAVLIDILIQSIFSIGLFYSLSLLGFKDLTLDAAVKGFGHSVMAAIILALIGLIWLGYYVILEAGFNGQTFGKRCLNIRVRKELGYAPTFWDILLRNMIRTIDFFPLFYVTGFFSMFLSSKSKRLGDFAAGTIVIKEIPHCKIGKFLNTQPAPSLPKEQQEAFTQNDQPWMNSLFFLLSQADYLLLHNLYNRRTQLTNYNNLVANTLQNLCRTKLSEETCPISLKEAPDLLERLLALYEQTYYNG